MFDDEISSMSNTQISIVLEKYEKFLKKTKSEYYQKRFTKLVDLLKKHVAEKIVLTPADLAKTRDVWAFGWLTMMKFISINIDFLDIFRYTLNKNECILLNIKNLSKIWAKRIMKNNLELCDQFYNFIRK